jgi:phosphoribosyl 1,2-cyclic phosphate phosphodiesterase
MSKICFTVLGSGSSGGVPRIGGHWGACDPENKKNRRRRCSLLIEKTIGDQATTILIDTSPDLRDQLLSANVSRLDGVLYTHFHADHIHGIDDLRMVVFNMKERINVWADDQTKTNLLDRFGYAFIKPETSPYPPILIMNSLN